MRYKNTYYLPYSHREAKKGGGYKQVSGKCLNEKDKTN